MYLHIASSCWAPAGLSQRADKCHWSVGDGQSTTPPSQWQPGGALRGGGAHDASIAASVTITISAKQRLLSRGSSPLLHGDTEVVRKEPLLVGGQDPGRAR